MQQPIIGILTWREGRKFAEPAYFRRLIKEGEKLGATLFLFSPQDVGKTTKRVNGFVPLGSGGWKRKSFPYPDVVIDRYRYTPTQAFKDYVAFRKENLFIYANNRLANKWKVHQVLWANEQMHKWLPETWDYSRAKVKEMLRKYPVIFLKPSNGTGGRGILKVVCKDGAYHLTGRDKQRVKKAAVCRTVSSLFAWVEKWKANQKFIVQQGLSIDLLPKRTVDLRLLIQKNEDGKWSITGQGIRIGKEKSVTSNLHGGGQAIAANDFLLPRFGVQKTHEILAQCHELAHQTAITIEDHFGRMIELGLDIGIDTDGRVWLIEVNPKPGRDIFRALGQTNRFHQSIRRPIQYAIYLHERNRQMLKYA